MTNWTPIFALGIRQGMAHPDQIAVADHRGNWTWRQLVSRIDELYEQFRPFQGQSIGIRLPQTADAYAALAALDELACVVVLFDDQSPIEQTMASATALQLNCILSLAINHAQSHWSTIPTNVAAGSPNMESRVIILTSGTEGVPKPVVHTWQSLRRPVRMNQSNDRQSWLLSYRVHLYAGLQVALQCLLNGGTLVIPAIESDPRQIVRLMVEHRVEFGSATPSYWRRLLLMVEKAEAKKVPLKQITLGGEPTDQQILDRLHELFPQARLVHIYATTEMGRCFAVTDGKAGFPISLLNQPTPDHVEIKVEEGQLYVRSANAMLDYYQSAQSKSDHSFDAWFATGDLVDIQGERVFFVGRLGDMINVGGNKVHPVLVENVIRQVPGIADVRVYARPSSITGQILACEIILVDGYQADQVRRGLLDACNNNLTSFQRPRFIDVVPEIAVSGAGKKTRR